MKEKYKFRLVLDESYSFGTVGRTGRGLTELYNVSAQQVDMIVGSSAKTLAACGGFCAASRVVTEHQRINGTAFVFSAAMPPLLAVAATEAINILTDTPSILSTLQENVRTVRTILEKVDCITIPSHPASPIIHVQVKPVSPSLLSPPAPGTPKPAALNGKSNPASVVPYNPTSFNLQEEERLLQQVVEEALAQGVMITRAKHLHGQEMAEPRPSIRISMTAALSKKDCEKAGNVIKAALIKVLAKRK